MSWSILFLLIAAILFALAAFNVAFPKVSLGWAGLFSLTLYWLFSSGVLPPH